jgi:hypothetical protein
MPRDARSWIVLALLVAAALTGCGHSYAASLGVSRRADGMTGAQAAVEWQLHVASWRSGSTGIGYLVYPGVRIGAGLDGDGSTRVIVEGVAGFGRAARHAGWAASARGRLGTAVGGDVSVGGSWRRSAREGSFCFHESCHDFLDVHYAAVGLQLGAEYMLVGADVWRTEAAIVAAWGVTQTDDDDDP